MYEHPRLAPVALSTGSLPAAIKGLTEAIKGLTKILRSFGQALLRGVKACEGLTEAIKGLTESLEVSIRPH